jgi:hydrogenase maturation protease
VGVEPEDIDTCGIELTPTVRRRVEPVIRMVLAELDRLGVPYRKKEEDTTHVPSDPFTNRPH